MTVPCGEEMGSFVLWLSWGPVVQHGATGQGGLTLTTGAGLAPFLLYVTKGLFQPRLGCIFFSLATAIPRYGGQQCSDFYSS